MPKILNPFRWKSYYYDVESGYYNISSRYYDPETATFLNVVTPEEMLSVAASIGGLNRDAITFGNFLAIAANGFDISTMDDFAVDMSYDPDANKPWWELTIDSMIALMELVMGALEFIVGIRSLGVALMLDGLVGLIVPGVQQVRNGLGTIIIGGSTFITGISLIGTGLVGIVLGIICLLVGFVAIAAGIFEIISGAIGVNYLGQWFGMSETTYYAIYIGINIACTVCTIVGQVYINSKATPPGRKDSGDCVGARDCFIAGTLIFTAEGYKKIEDIQVGDLVLAYDEATGEQAYKEVVRLFRNENTEWTGVTVNGTEIISTTGHKYYLPESKSWVSAVKLKVGTKVLLSDGSYGTIEKVRNIHYDTPQTTYNFEVEDFHTYYVSTGVLVHNKNCKINQMNEDVKRGRAPKEIESVHQGNTNTQTLPHVHFTDGTSLNIDGTIHDQLGGIPQVGRKARKWLTGYGWEVPKEFWR